MPRERTSVSVRFASLQSGRLGGTGFEPNLVTDESAITYRDNVYDDVLSDAVDDAISADLAELTALWPSLSDETRQAVLAFAEKSVTCTSVD